MKKLVLMMVFVLMSMFLVLGANVASATQEGAAVQVGELIADEKEQGVEVQTPVESTETRRPVREQNVEQTTVPPQIETRETNRTVREQNNAGFQSVSPQGGNRTGSVEHRPGTSTEEGGRRVTRDSSETADVAPVTRNRDLERRVQTGVHGSEQVFQTSEGTHSGTDGRTSGGRGNLNHQVGNEHTYDPNRHDSHHHGHHVQENFYNIIISDEVINNDLFMAHQYILSWERINLTSEQRREILELQINLFRNLAEQDIILTNLMEEKRFLESIYNFISLRRNAEEMITVRRQKNGFIMDFQEAVFAILTPEQRDDYLRIRGLRRD